MGAAFAKALRRAKGGRWKVGGDSMTDLKNPKWMYAKAVMLLLIGVITFGLLLLRQELWAKVVLQVLMIWAFARAYYFAFYVIQHYVDGNYRFSGLFDFMKYLFAKHQSGGCDDRG